MDITYCFENCPIGKAAGEVYKYMNNSMLDAASDFNAFADNCFKTCPFKSVHCSTGTSK